MSELRVGYGFDVHRFIEGNGFVLGGVMIEFPRGLEGHADADVLVHVIVDAILGAACMGDIGENFPPSDPKYADISSRSLLELTKIKLGNAGYEIDNIDATIICEEPQLDEYKLLMAEIIAAELDIGTHQVSVKATRTDGLGCTGEKKGIAAAAVVLLSETYVEEEEKGDADLEDEFEDE